LTQQDAWAIISLLSDAITGGILLFLRQGQQGRLSGQVLALMVGLGLLGGAAAMLLGAYSYRSGKSPVLAIREVFKPPFDGKKHINILALGVDNSIPERGLSDTMILVSVDLPSRKVYAVSIPRDTRIEDETVGPTHKINGAYPRGGHELAIQTVQNLLGISIEYYAKIDLEGFVRCVDILGGVDIEVDRNMHYRDRAQHLFINLKKGWQHLDGEKAMQYVRFRRDAMGDITRTERQQKFLHALVDKVLTPSNLPRLPRLVGELIRHVDTNLTPKDVLYLTDIITRMSGDRLETHTLPGTPRNIDGGSYWVVDEAKIAEMVAQYFRLDPSAFAQAPTVVVLNGNGVEGAAARFAETLYVNGFQIASCGNADRHDYSTSSIIARPGRAREAQEIAAFLPGATVTEEPQPETMADITVILGKDYDASPAIPEPRP